MRHFDVVVAVIIVEDKVLCLKRGESPYPYAAFRYEFPGGKVEPGESRVEALVRELDEELGLIVNPDNLEFFMSVDHSYPDFSVSVHAFLYKRPYISFDLNVHVGFLWVPLSDLSRIDWVMADKALVNKLEELGEV